MKAVRFSGSDMIDDVMDLKPEEEKPTKPAKKGSKKQKQKGKENSEQEKDKSKAKTEKGDSEKSKPTLEKSHSEGILTNAVEVMQTTLQVIYCNWNETIINVIKLS
jgi:hypothetical protein